MVLFKGAGQRPFHTQRFGHQGGVGDRPLLRKLYRSGELCWNGPDTAIVSALHYWLDEVLDEDKSRVRTPKAAGTSWECSAVWP